MFNRVVSGKNNKERGSEANVEKQGQVVFGTLHTPVSRVLTLPAFITTTKLILTACTHLYSNKPVEKQVCNQPASASTTCKSRCKSLGNVPLAVLPASDEWEGPSLALVQF